MRRRMASKWIREEIERIYADEFFDGDRIVSPEPLNLARALHARAFADGNWSVGINDAHSITRIVMLLEKDHGEVAAAERRIHELMAHPRFRRLPSANWYRAWMATFEIRRGAVEEGIARLRTLPRRWGPGRRRYVSMAFAILFRKEEALPEPLDPRLIAFFKETVAYQGGTKRYLAVCGDRRDELVLLLERTHMRPQLS